MEENEHDTVWKINSNGNRSFKIIQVKRFDVGRNEPQKKKMINWSLSKLKTSSSKYTIKKIKKLQCGRNHLLHINLRRFLSRICEELLKFNDKNITDLIF